MVSHPKTALRKKNIVKFLLTGIKSIVYNDKCAISSLLGVLRLNTFATVGYLFPAC